MLKIILRARNNEIEDTVIISENGMEEYFDKSEDLESYLINNLSNEERTQLLNNKVIIDAANYNSAYDKEIKILDNQRQLHLVNKNIKGKGLFGLGIGSVTYAGLSKIAKLSHENFKLKKAGLSKKVLAVVMAGVTLTLVCVGCQSFKNKKDKDQPSNSSNIEQSIENVALKELTTAQKDYLGVKNTVLETGKAIGNEFKSTALKDHFEIGDIEELGMDSKEFDAVYTLLNLENSKNVVKGMTKMLSAQDYYDNFESFRFKLLAYSYVMNETHVDALSTLFGSDKDLVKESFTIISKANQLAKLEKQDKDALNKLKIETLENLEKYDETSNKYLQAMYTTIVKMNAQVGLLNEEDLNKLGYTGKIQSSEKYESIEVFELKCEDIAVDLNTLNFIIGATANDSAMSVFEIENIKLDNLFDNKLEDMEISDSIKKEYRKNNPNMTDKEIITSFVLNTLSKEYNLMLKNQLSTGTIISGSNAKIEKRKVDEIISQEDIYNGNYDPNNGPVLTPGEVPGSSESKTESKGENVIEKPVDGPVVEQPPVGEVIKPPLEDAVTDDKPIWSEDEKANAGVNYSAEVDQIINEYSDPNSNLNQAEEIVKGK